MLTKPNLAGAVMVVDEGNSYDLGMSSIEINESSVKDLWGEFKKT